MRRFAVLPQGLESARCSGYIHISDEALWTLSEAGTGKGHRPWAVAFLLIGGG